MATSVKRRLEGQSSTITGDGRWEVVVPYIVIGPSGIADVHDAEDADTGLDVPQKGSVHPDNTTLLCDEVRIDWVDQAVDGDAWHVDAVYRSPQFEFTAIPATEYQWGESVRQIEAFSDRNAKPFLNSARDVLIGSFPDEIFDSYLDVWRTIPVFDPVLANAVRGRVNSAAMSLFGTWSIEAQQMRLVSYRPENTFKVGTSVSNVRVYHRFEFRSGYRPFQPRAVDQGFNAYSGSQKGYIYPLGASEPTQIPVLFDGGGAPINSGNYRIRRSPGDPELPISSAPAWPVNFTQDPASSAAVGVTLVWDRVPTYSFAGFIPGIM